MAGRKRVAKKHVPNRRKSHKGTTILPAHMLGKSLTKKVGRKRSRKRSRKA
jgi:hypothetical protein